MSRFTIVGKKLELSGGGLVDIGRTGMVRGVTEQTEFVLSLGGVHLGVLGGERARSSKFMRPLTARQRNANDAMRVLLGRPACDHSSAADTAVAGHVSAAQVKRLRTSWTVELRHRLILPMLHMFMKWARRIGIALMR